MVEKKRVLVIGLSAILGGVETYLYNLITHLNISNYSFDFLIVGAEKKSVFEYELNKYFNDNEIHFFYAPILKKNYFKAKAWLKDFYRKNKYDVIYLNTCTTARVNYCKYALKNKRVKLITHSHNGSGQSLINNFLFRGFILKRSQYLLSCSDIASRWLFGKTKKPIIIVPNGIDTERFAFNFENRSLTREKYNLQNKIVIGHVGRFSEQKNHKFFIDLALKLDNNYVFLLVGDGPLKDDFIAEIKKLDISNKFIICNNSLQVEKYYSAMDVFMMPSLYEGLPIVALEAQCNGLACLFSDNISKQTSLSEHCRFLSLKNVNDWISWLMSDFCLQRYDGIKVIKDKNFDLESTVNILESIL